MPNAHGGREILGSGIGTVERDINEKTFEPRLKLMGRKWDKFLTS